MDLAPGTRVLTRGRHGTADLAPMRDVFMVNDDVADQDAAFHTLLRITMQAVRKARVELGETVLVIGGGLIGQLAAQWAYAAGAGRVLVADLDPSRRAMAEAVPWLESMDPASEEARAELAEGPTGGPPVVIESTGFPAPINDAFIMAGHCARVVLLGSTRGATESVNFYRDVHKKGLTIIGAHDSIRQPDACDNPFLNALAVHWSARRDVAVAMRMAAAGRITLDPLITHRVEGQRVRVDLRPALRLRADAGGLPVRLALAGYGWLRRRPGGARSGSGGRLPGTRSSGRGFGPGRSGPGFSILATRMPEDRRWSRACSIRREATPRRR